MNDVNSFPPDSFWQKDSFQLIKPEEFQSLGIDTEDIPLGTFAARNHPSYLQSKYGGNAYGFGLFEFHDRLAPDDLKLLQSIEMKEPKNVCDQYKTINNIYKKIGLLIRFSSLGFPYYLIPDHLISNTLTHIKAKVDKISDILDRYRKKHLKTSHQIGLLTNEDDLIIQELTIRFKEHSFIVLDSIQKMNEVKIPLDLVILTRDPFELLLNEKFNSIYLKKLTKSYLEQYAGYMFWKVYRLLKQDGGIFIIANHYIPKSNQTTKLVFKSQYDEKNFILFSHIFKTKKKYNAKNKSYQVNIYDLQKYLNGFYVDQEVIDKLLEGTPIEKTSMDHLKNLHYLNYPLIDTGLLKDQEKSWENLLLNFFDKEFLKPFLPETVVNDWKKRFVFSDGFTPNYKMIFFGKKKTLKTSIAELMKNVNESGLQGCPFILSADYRNSFDYVIQTLNVLERLKKRDYRNLPNVFIDSLTQPLENRKRRFAALNNTIKLTSKIAKLEKIKKALNPENIEGDKTKILENLEALTFFGFTFNELKEIVLIVLGHTPLGRIISGKMNEKSLRPISNLARTMDIQQALNLLRYCRLMTMAETEAARSSELPQEQLSELFDLHESIVKMVTNQDLNWEELLDEKINLRGGIHNKVIRKLLMMMDHFEFLDNWQDLKDKGQMEKEALADYDEKKLSRIENVIRLVNITEKFEEIYLQSDPVQLPAFYRKFLDLEFHGTSHVFRKMNSEHIFTLLWITSNVVRGDIINFNPLLAEETTEDIESKGSRIDQEARAINMKYLTLTSLRQFEEQLYKHGSSFIVGTGFQLKVKNKTQTLEILYLDIDRDIKSIQNLTKKLSGRAISSIPAHDLEKLEKLFSNIESFFQFHLSILSQTQNEIKLPSKQTLWFNKIKNQRQDLKSKLLSIMFSPEHIHDDISILLHNAPTLLGFILPEFAALENLDLSWHLYLTSPVTHYILSATKKFQALVRHEKESFQNKSYLHKLAQEEFGPMAAGIIGVNESQIEWLENIVEKLLENKPLFDALIKAFILQDVGRVPHLVEKYRSEINPADIAHTGELFIEKENIASRYHLDDEGARYLKFLVRHHSRMHHIIRGEFAIQAIQNVINTKNTDLFDAFFILSFVMLASIRDDLIREDAAIQLFNIRKTCHRIMNSEITLEMELQNTLYYDRGILYYAANYYHEKGLPEGMSASVFLTSKKWDNPGRAAYIKAGKQIAALERFFRLRGLKYVQYLDLISIELKIPMKYIYKKRKFSSIGYATFEKELREALIIYQVLHDIKEEIRHFIFDMLSEDKVRIFSYEKASGYLSYEDQIKLLFIGLLTASKFESINSPVSISYFELSKIVEKRYEAITESLKPITMDKLWDGSYKLSHFIKAKTGIVIDVEEQIKLCSFNFQDRINIPQKISYMLAINNVDQLRSYYNNSIKSLKKQPYFTEDYQQQLKIAFNKRLTEITSMIISQTTERMELLHDFEELYHLNENIAERAEEIGFIDSQKQRLKDVYELRKDNLKREKLYEIEKVLNAIIDTSELKDYWDSIKWYLQSNRKYFGKEFETIIAKKFDNIRQFIEGPDL